MSTIQRLDVSRLRNLKAIRIQPSSRVNVLYGSNGSGKTSLLEAIYLLGVGRSFRSQKLDPIIATSEDDCVVFGELADGVAIGVSKSRRQGHVLKILGEKQRSWAEAARHLPVQILNSESFSLLEGSPKVRRRFMDWGVFHVEHEFVNNWRRASKCIAQRNLLLKQRVIDSDQLSAWDSELSLLSKAIDTSRSDYFALLRPQITETLSRLIELPDLDIKYFRGWEQGADLATILKGDIGRDIRYGATQHGPHRADIVVKIGRLPAHEVLSRGQQKLLVSAMKIAQGHLLTRHSGIGGIYLVDDLPAELDLHNRKLVCELLEVLGCQIFLTCVDVDDLKNCWSPQLMPRKFHVEHGKITLQNESAAET